MKADLRTALQTGFLTGDGAMGTYLYQLGFPVGISYEEFNIIKPEIILDIHRQYYKAGARLIETNTFSANREKLSKFGLEDETVAINKAGVALARQAARDDAYVMGAVGSLRGSRRRRIDDLTLKHDLAEQISALLEAGADGILLETFYELSEMLIAVKIVRNLGNAPLICQFATDGSGVTQDGISFEVAFQLLKDAGADAVGFNCHSGPDGILRALEKLSTPPVLPLSIYPNAGLPGYDDGRLTYLAEPDYFATKALRFAELGARIIGGCCGTTPQHIAAIAHALADSATARSPLLVPAAPARPSAAAGTAANRGTAAGRTGRITAQPVAPLAPAEPPAPAEPSLIDLVRQRHTVIVELDSPRDLSTERFMAAAALLKEAGVDALTMADNSLAMTRISNLPMGHLVQDRLGLRPLLHVACRDRNAIGTQSHLMGMNALGINHVLAITGDPARVGDLPDASSVFDMNSLDLIRMARQLNEGVAFSGKLLKQKANFIIGAALDPNVKYMEKAIERMAKKIEAGAQYFMTQPVYDIEKIEKLYEATKHLNIPIFIGIMPLMSGRNAEFLHNEVPGIRITEEVRQRMAGLSGEDGRQAGVEIAKELIDAAITRFKGIYLMTPMLFASMTAELTRHIKVKTQG
ncbi:MAG: bifunctional homocysteine S-methyltransferase/methylenetetrahydrofolate reductase [Gorillibacterium sp.]|nr:bifunctional homocysteine S-methyltransferase/methylenetetrahydrofolate reductase [Gorillibacterium sp.]